MSSGAALNGFSTFVSEAIQKSDVEETSVTVSGGNYIQNGGRSEVSSNPSSMPVIDTSNNARYYYSSKPSSSISKWSWLREIPYYTQITSTQNFYRWRIPLEVISVTSFGTLGQRLLGFGKFRLKFSVAASIFNGYTPPSFYLDFDINYNEITPKNIYPTQSGQGNYVDVYSSSSPTAQTITLVPTAISKRS